MVDVSLRLWFFHLTGGGYYPNGIEGVVVILIAVVGCHPKLVVVLPLLVEGCESSIAVVTLNWWWWLLPLFMEGVVVSLL